MVIFRRMGFNDRRASGKSCHKTRVTFEIPHSGIWEPSFEWPLLWRTGLKWASSGLLGCSTETLLSKQIWVFLLWSTWCNWFQPNWAIEPVFVQGRTYFSSFLHSFTDSFRLAHLRGLQACFIQFALLVCQLPLLWAARLKWATHALPVLGVSCKKQKLLGVSCKKQDARSNYSVSLPDCSPHNQT